MSRELDGDWDRYEDVIYNREMQNATGQLLFKYWRFKGTKIIT
jgi:hypothetical protein